MSVTLVDPFDAQMPFPLDLRMRKADINGRNSIPTNSRYPGMLCWTDNERVVWVLDVGSGGDPANNTNWKQLYPAAGGATQNVTWSANAPTTQGSDGDIWFRDNAGTGNVDLYFKAGGSWGLLGSWSKEGSLVSYTEDPSLPDPPTKSYLNSNYPSAKVGDVVYWEGTTQVVEAKCYAAGEWNYSTKNRAL